MSGKSLHDDRSRGTVRNAANTGNGKTVCIDAGRVFDSCSDRDCVEDLKVYFRECDQQVVENALYVRAKKAKVLGTAIDVEELPLQEGCYSCKLTFFIEVQVEVTSSYQSPTDTLRGCTVFEKKVVLYGGEGAVQVFSSEFSDDCCYDHRDMSSAGMPRCTVQVAEPVVLDARLVEACGCRCASCCCACDMIPDTIASRLGGRPIEATGERMVMVTVGLFTIVQMIRQVQVLVPVYDYCVPCKDCNCDEETPCEVFRRMSFPIEEFFPSMSRSNGK